MCLFLRELQTIYGGETPCKSGCRHKWAPCWTRPSPSASGGRLTVTPHSVRQVVSQLAAVPIEEITQEERMRLSDLNARLSRKIIGQDEAIAKVVAAIKRSRAGLADPKRPDAAMLFLGPTGVGKRSLAIRPYT